MKLDQIGFMFGLAAVLCLSTGNLRAQERGANGNNNGDQAQGDRRGRGNFDPAAFQQRMMDNVKERLAFTNDAEWAAVQPLVQKVFDARRDVGFGGGMGFMRGGRGNGGGDPGGARRNPAEASNPEAVALQKALDDKVPPAQLKTVLEKYRAAHGDKQAKLEAAQENLRKVLTARQEAQAVMLGLLN